jgi:hypothetical protein
MIGIGSAITAAASNASTAVIFENLTAASFKNRVKTSAKWPADDEIYPSNEKSTK